MKDGISFLFHLPHKYNDFDRNILCQIRWFIDSLNFSLRLYPKAESWELIYQKNNCRFDLFQDSEDEFEEKVLNRSDKVCAASCMVNYNDKSTIWIYTSLRRAISNSIWMIKDEIAITITLSKSIIETIDNHCLIEMLFKMRMNLKASYICGDLNYICPRSIYLGNFRRFCEESFKIDVERMIPGIYLIQYVSYSMIDSMVPIQTIKSELLNGHVAVYDDNDGLWIILDDHFQDYSLDKKMIMRNVLKNSLYTISKKELQMQIDHIPDAKFVIRSLPLSNDELSSLHISTGW